MSEPESFVARWSRRKRAAARADAPAAASRAAETALAPAQACDAPGLTEAELAELPALDALTAESDVTAFLRAGVPRAMRNAALRRAWSLDPKVRDFVCEAQEYAYDWNVPGGVPGYGPLPAGFDVKALVGRLFGAREASPVGPHAAASASPALTVEQAPLDASAAEDARGPEVAVPSAGECCDAPSIATADGAAGARALAQADEPRARGLEESSCRRRHGGATPVLS